MTRKGVLAHVVGAGPGQSQDDEGQHHQPGGGHHLSAAEALHHPSPQPAEIEEVAGDEDIAEAHRYLIARPEGPIADGWEEKCEPAQVAHLVDVVHHNIDGEEGEEEPDGRVAVEAALHPEVAPLQGLDELVVAFRQGEVEAEIDGGSDDAAHQVGHEQPLAPVAQVVEVGGCRRAFVEVAGLEEEETHEEEAPAHHLDSPLLPVLSAEGHDVERHHPDDADAAEDVEGVVALFHSSAVCFWLLSGKTSSAGRWLTFISSGMSLRTCP